MRGAATKALREGFAVSARPPWGYGVLCAVALSLPLIIGTLAGHPREGSLAALGAYFTAFGDRYGKPYGERAKRLAGQLLLVPASFALGSLLSPHPWTAVATVGLLAAAGGQWPAFGIVPALTMVMGYYDALPLTWSPSLLMGAGGVLYCVLALGSWPWRRFDSLQEALGSACTAVADLLEAVEADGEEWVRLRGYAFDAVDEAATASAAYRSSEEHDETPDAFVRTLQRTLHEVVALRALCPPPEAREAVTALVGALRGAADGSDARVKHAIEADRAFGRWAEKHDRDPQVKRCLDRITAGARTVATLSKRGVQAPETLPSFSWPDLKEPRHALRLGVTTAAAMALMVGLHADIGRWFVVTVLIALRSTYGDTVERVVLRVVGTMAGATVAALLLAAVPGRWTIVVIILVFGALGFALREVSYGFWSALATPLMLMMSDFSVTIDWVTAAVRLGLTAAGGVLVLLAARVLWPRGEAGKIRGFVVEVLKEHARLLRCLADQDLDSVPERLFEAGSAGDRLAESLDRVELEPGRGYRASAHLREVVTTARRIRDDAMVVGALMRGTGRGVGVGVLDACADQLEELAEAVRDRRDPPEFPGEVDERAGRAQKALWRHVGELSGQLVG
ncbi:FUSC family protein [Nonomuraea sp. NPDC050310]|uniref:FUSC family protein n=1 Tax=Nonomuraea sp. NPDC050310 TaxID=3154935 RepID=UPI0034117CCA